MAVGQAPEVNQRSLDWKTQETFRLLKNSPGTVYQECSDVEKQIYRDWVRSLLRNSEITVSFTKADGTVRDMLCTLDFSRIPDAHHPKTVPASDEPLNESKPIKLKDDETQSVFDLEKQQWRSFRYERLKKISADIALG